ncbi:hypothetical protein TcG_12106 [Trypanosoma cruzi]|nr:hypothetical protein TcG_12106 [Trypanosoma cruzi]
MHGNRRRAHHLNSHCRQSKRASVPNCCSTHRFASIVSRVFSQINRDARTAVARALTPRGVTTVSRHKAAGPEAGGCRLHCANDDPVRETLLAPKFSRQYGVLGPGTAVRQSSIKSQGEATMTQAQGSHSTLN